MKTAAATTAFRPGPGPSDRVLVDREWLQAHLSDPHVRVVEVDVSAAAYDDWHIDGAVLWNIYADLKDADYRLAGTATLERLIARSGIGPDSTVVFYGYAPALGLWLMKLYGHPAAHTGLLTRHLAGRRRPAEHRRERTADRRLLPRRRGLWYPGRPSGGTRDHRPAGNHPDRRPLSG